MNTRRPRSSENQTPFEWKPVLQRVSGFPSHALSGLSPPLERDAVHFHALFAGTFSAAPPANASRAISQYTFLAAAPNAASVAIFSHTSSASRPLSRERNSCAFLRAAGEPLRQASRMTASRSFASRGLTTLVQNTFPATFASASCTARNQARTSASVAQDAIAPNAFHAALRVAASGDAMNGFQRGRSFSSARFAATDSNALSFAASSNSFSPAPGRLASASSAALPTSPPRLRASFSASTSATLPKTPSATHAATATSSFGSTTRADTSFTQSFAPSCASRARIAHARSGVASASAFLSSPEGIASPRPKAAWRTCFAGSDTTARNADGSSMRTMRAATARSVSERSLRAKILRAVAATAFAPSCSVWRASAAPSRNSRS